jgi:hypothetical protein
MNACKADHVCLAMYLNGWIDFSEIWYAHYAVEGFPKFIHHKFSMIGNTNMVDA